MALKDQDYLYLGLGAGALWLILKNTKPLSEGIVEPVSKVVGSASSVVTPLLSAAGKGAEIVTNPESYKLENYSYTYGLLKAPFTTDQAYRLWKQKGGFLGTGPLSPETINLAATALGAWR